MVKGPPSKRIALKGLIILALFYAAALLTHHQLIHTQMLKESRVSIDSYIDGTVSRPFAYRVVIPQTQRAFIAATPRPVAEVLDHWGQAIRSKVFHGFTLASNGDPILSGPGSKYPQAIFMLAALHFACLVGYALIGSSLYARLFPNSNFRAVAAPFLLLLLFPIVSFGVGHMYDFSVLLFSSCLLLAMAYYAVVFFRRLPFSFYAFMLAAQLAIFLVIYISMKAVFAGNPGGPMEIWLFDQAGWYWHQPMTFFLVASLVAFVISFRWNEKPPFLRRSMIMVLPHCALFLYAAYAGEWRNWYESVPMLSMFVLRNVEFMCGLWWAPSAPASPRLECAT